MRVRKGRAYVWPVRRCGGFNGAALVRVRKGGLISLAYKSFMLLQRGRTRESAEGGANRGRRGALQNGFNGAALVRVRKGPRPGQRHAPARSCFNGAALVRVRKVAGCLPCCCWFQGFNGAALVRVRKASKAARAWARFSGGFNGAALVRVRKGSCRETCVFFTLCASTGPHS